MDLVCLCRDALYPGGSRGYYSGQNRTAEVEAEGPARRSVSNSVAEQGEKAQPGLRLLAPAPEQDNAETLLRIAGDPGQMTPEEQEAIRRKDFPLLDLCFGRKDTGAVLLSYHNGKQYYLSTAVSALERSKDKLFIYTFAVGRGTTPEFEMKIYKNDKLVKSIPVMSINFAGLEHTFSPVTLTKARSEATVAALTSRRNPGRFRIRCEIHDETVLDAEGIYSEDDAIEEELSRLYRLDKRDIELYCRASHPKPDRYSEYTVEITCGQDFYEGFDRSLLADHWLLENVSIGEYQPEQTDTVYFEATE